MRFSDLFTGKQRLESAKARVEAARAAVAAATDEGLQPAGALSELRKAEGLLAARMPEEAVAHAARAEAVANELIHEGVEPARVSPRGYGETNLRVQTPDNVDEPRNRRVEIVLEPVTG